MFRTSASAARSLRDLRTPRRTRRTARRGLTASTTTPVQASTTALVQASTTTPVQARTTTANQHRADGLHSVLGEQLFQHVRDAIVVSDVDSGRILRWNPAAEQLFGYASEEALGLPVEALMPAAVARVHRERLTQYARSGEPDVLLGRGPLSVPALDRAGREIPVELSIVPLETRPGALARWIALVFRDATCAERAERRAQEATRAMTARAETERKLQRCQELLRSNAVELATPVARAQRSAARLARLAGRNGQTSPAKLARLADVVQRRTDRVQRSLRQMADVAAIETGTFELHRDKVNLVPLANRVVSACRLRSRVHRINVAAPQGLTAVCDAERVEAVLADLLERAMRRNPRGCWIDVDLTRPLVGTARIEVRDYGRPASALERAGWVDANADRGWFVNRYVIEQHGGTLGVEKAPEGGVRVIVNVPTHRGRRD